jgi:hypothetical protein
LDTSAVSAAKINNKPAEGRKPNFFERKRFVDYEKNNSDSDKESADIINPKENKNVEVPF